MPLVSGENGVVGWLMLIVSGAYMKLLLVCSSILHGYTLHTLAEAGEAASSKSHNKINADKSPLSEVELDKEEDSEKIKAASLRSVTLWVLAAVTFGVGIAMRDGLGKATEYFAG